MKSSVNRQTEKKNVYRKIQLTFYNTKRADKKTSKLEYLHYLKYLRTFRSGTRFLVNHFNFK